MILHYLGQCLWFSSLYFFNNDFIISSLRFLSLVHMWTFWKASWQMLSLHFSKLPPRQPWTSDPSHASFSPKHLPRYSRLFMSNPISCDGLRSPQTLPQRSWPWAVGYPSALGRPVPSTCFQVWLIRRLHTLSWCNICAAWKDHTYGVLSLGLADAYTSTVCYLDICGHYHSPCLLDLRAASDILKSPAEKCTNTRLSFKIEVSSHVIQRLCLLLVGHGGWQELLSWIRHLWKAHLFGVLSNGW